MNDRRHKIVSDDIVFIEIDVPDVFHMLQHALGIDEAALDMRGKIDLRGIAIDDHLRSVSEACQEHFCEKVRRCQEQTAGTGRGGSG